MSSSSRNLIAASGNPGVAAVGQVVFVGGATSALVTTWIVPSGVTSISAFCVTGGRGGGIGRGGDGAGVAWANQVTVIPGEQLNIYVGGGSSGSSTISTSRRYVGSGQQCYITRDSDGTILVRIRMFYGQVSGGVGDETINSAEGGKGVVFSGETSAYSGGGAGAKAFGGRRTPGVTVGDGGIGDQSNPVSGQDGVDGGGGGGGYGVFAGAIGNRCGDGGGGVGLLGEGASGAGDDNGPGEGGSGGSNGTFGGSNSGGNGGSYGAGGGGGAYDDGPPEVTIPGGTGAPGAIRIIWPGDERQYPSTRTADE